MTPVEINKKIAEIKGFSNIRPFHDGIYFNYKPEDEVNYFPENFKKNWAEKISDAWELFEEMGGARIENLGCFKCWASPAYDSHYEDTGPLAICMAWLEWKGVEI